MKIRGNADWLLIIVAGFLCYAVARGQDTIHPPDFQQVRQAIDGMRSGDGSDLTIRFDDASFTIRRTNRTEITSSAAAELMKNAQEQGLPQFRLAHGKFFLVWEIKDDSWVEQEQTKDPGKATWFQRTLETVGTFPTVAWRPFMEFAMQEHLAHYASYDTKEGTVGLLLFRPIGPPSVAYGAGTLHLTDQFYQWMRFSPDHPAVDGSAGFVILVHDPHSDVAGRYSLLRGLEALLSANKNTSVCFLNEGAFRQLPGQTYRTLLERRISDHGIRTGLAGVSPQARTAAIYSLTRRFLIDVPRAYQELHPKTQIASYKIDDNRYLAEPEIVRIRRVDLDKAMDDILEPLQQKLSAKKENASAPAAPLQTLLENFYMARAMLGADVLGMNDEDAVGYEAGLAIRFAKLGDSAATMFPQSAKVAGAVKTLRAAAQEHAQEALTYENALKRNETMAKYIATAAENSSAYGGIPVAFIGSYHTEGITADLREKHIGYVVIEPQRASTFPGPESEQKQFDRFVQDRTSYFRSLSLNKGAAELTPLEVQTFVLPNARRAVKTYASREAELTAAVPPGSTVDARRLSDSVLGNPYAHDTAVSVSGGGGHIPPDAPSGTFAYFEAPDGKPRLYVLGIGDARWKEDGSRYDYLQEVTLRLPQNMEEVSGFHCLQALTIPWQDAQTGRPFFSIYYGKQRRLYLVEESIPQVAALLTPPVKKGKQTVEFGMQLAEIVPENKEGEADGD